MNKEFLVLANLGELINTRMWVQFLDAFSRPVEKPQFKSEAGIHRPLLRGCDFNSLTVTVPQPKPKPLNDEPYYRRIEKHGRY